MNSAIPGVAERLRKRVRGEVRVDEGSRALYSTDASNYRQMPIGVVIPRDVEDVMETVAAAPAFALPALARGRDQPGRAVLQRRHRHGLLEVHARHPGDRHRASPGSRSAGGEVWVKCGERVLLPAVRRADAGALIVADGFSCREQIAQSTSRRAMHLAEVLWQARRS